MKQKYIPDLSFEAIQAKAEYYCAYQERCSTEVIQKLKEYNLDSKQIDELLKYLISEGFVNNERFAKIFSVSKFNVKKWGKEKIRYELRLRKISDSIINLSLETIDPNEYLSTLTQLAQKKIKEIKTVDIYQRNNKVLAFLKSKGYETELIFQTLKNL